MRNQLVNISIKARYQKSVFEMQVGNVIVAINGDGKNNKIQWKITSSENTTGKLWGSSLMPLLAEVTWQC